MRAGSSPARCSTEYGEWIPSPSARVESFETARISVTRWLPSGATFRRRPRWKCDVRDIVERWLPRTAGSLSRWTLRCREARRWHHDWSEDPARIVERRLQSAQLAALLGGLPPRQREVLLLHYYNETSLRAVGRRLAISPQRASQLHTSAIARLKRDAHVATY